MMAAESQEEDQPLMAEYRSKFPEIPEHVLARILREHGDNPKSCEKILQEESEKYLYGSSPTSDISTTIKGSTVNKPKPSPVSNATHGSPINLNRCNSTGSTSSGHSSGRSTPVFQIPTPWVVPKFHPTSTGADLVTNQYPTTTSGGIPSGMVYPQFNGGYYYHPWAGAGHQVSPNSMAVNQTSPNAGYPMMNTGGYFPVQSSTVTMPTSAPPASDTGTPVGPQYSTMPTNPTLQPGFLYYSPVSTGVTTSPFYGSSSPQMDTRYQTLPATIPYLPGALIVSGSSPAMKQTPNLPTSSGFTPVHSSAEVNRHNFHQLHASASNTQISENKPYAVNTNPMQFDPRYVAYIPENMMPSVSGYPTRTNTPYMATNAGFVPINQGTTMRQQSLDHVNAASSTGETSMTPQTQGLVNRQVSSGSTSSGNEELWKLGDTSPAPNDEYLRACLSQQMKRLQNLSKEFAVEEQRLQIIISEISDRDHDLYNKRYRVAPNPTQVDIQKLVQENDGLKRTIEEISKNIDRLDNGRSILPTPNPMINPTQRIIGNRPKEPFDRSKSVPCLHQPGPGKPPLNRPLSEHDSNIDFEQNRVQYRLTPPPDSTLQDWSLINRTHPDPNPIGHVNNDEGTQWNCSKCTFLNHESLLACEICGNKR